MKLIPKKQGGGGMWSPKTDTTGVVAKWLNVAPTSETANRTINWGMISPRNAVQKMWSTLPPEITSKYNVSGYTNYLLANPTEINKYPGFRFNPDIKKGATTSPFEYSGYTSGEVQMDTNPSKDFNKLVGKGKRVAAGQLPFYK